MKVELHINGRLNIELMPETEIEKLVLHEMLTHAGKGKAVRMESGTAAAESVYVSVEK